jgi:hypothetical protein
VKEGVKGDFSLAGFTRLMLIDMCILAGAAAAAAAQDDDGHTPFLQVVIICPTSPALASCARMLSSVSTAAHPLPSRI